MFLKICLLIFCMILPQMAWNVYNRNTDHQQEMRDLMAKSSIYAVARGRACGLFTSWQECEKQIKGYPGARYKGFADVAAALAERGEVRGECVIVVEEGDGSDVASGPELPLDDAIAAGLAAGESKSALAKRLARVYGMPKGDVYARVLELA